ncbi:hypothetical protein EIP91_008501 [Steccherinum ochraceum]|uniref:Pentacotripeptide-repeat region of PRORP domain-containing protein n=1 Tax=Steccherinum ochraceum TaxID=92696 RepID=A0A4R0RSB4_9APHY|nr:hypothetical protein EIP91_008501 [Steccherinum ochraceum]
MLPKVASQILQHTSRAVAAVQGQTGHAVRSVLQTGSTNLGQWNPGSSSSGWNGSGPSSGGAKFHSSSSRFHTSYTGAGRSVAHADASSSYSDAVDTSDEGFELVAAKDNTISIRSKRRPRSSSLSFTLQVQKEPGHRGVLKAIKQHVRSRHAFAVSKDTAGAESDLSDVALLDQAPTSTNILDPGASKEGPSSPKEDSEAVAGLFSAKNANDLEGVKRESEALRSSQPPSVFVYNSILEALRVTRPFGAPLDDIMTVYNEMIALSIRPNVGTYGTLILSLTDRDREVSTAIKNTEKRLQQRHLIGAAADEEGEFLEKHVESLRAEQNFTSAMTLLKTARATGRKAVWGPNQVGDLSVYGALLRSCVGHADVVSAVEIFSYLEQGLNAFDKLPYASLYMDMILVHIAAGDMSGAEIIFEEYQRLARDGGLRVFNNSADYEDTAQHLHMIVWNNMVQGHIKCGQPQEGLKLLERMMDSEAGVDFTTADVPRPSPATYFGIVHSFINTGDVNSALIWFNKLLQQKDSSDSVLSPSGLPVKPDHSVWTEMLIALAKADMVDDFNRLMLLAAQQEVSVSLYCRILGVKLSLDHIDAHPEMDSQTIIETLDFFVDTVNNRWDSYLWIADGNGVSSSLLQRLIQTYLRLGNTSSALRVLQSLVHYGEVAASKTTSDEFVDAKLEQSRSLRNSVQELLPFFTAEEIASSLSLQDVYGLWYVADHMNVEQIQSVCAMLLSSYAAALPTLRREDIKVGLWHALFRAALSLDRISGPELPTVESLVCDLVRMKRAPFFMSPTTRREVGDRLTAALGIEEAKALLLSACKSNPDITSFIPEVDASVHSLESAPESPSIPLSYEFATPVVNVDPYHSRFIDENYSSLVPSQVLQGYRKFEAGLKDGVYPNAEVLGRLINAVGRLGELQKVRNLYEASQTVLASLNHDKRLQSVGWFQVEDQMVIALAHAGETDAAHVHRTRILEHGGTPSADAYAALIQRVKDTTDDTANAMTLFQEARARGVSPNIFLYNTVISKLAKARKVDYALELFQEMKAAGFRPTSVTYGAVIAACCRVGDAQSAEILFQEMSSQPNFKPRVPPFNTMMQLYTHTKPDRERVLYYANALRRAHVYFTAHTYKLLMDAYGTIEPLDLSAMEDTFKTLEADRKVAINGTHWASMINAYGCAGKDLDKAISTFESIAAHPSSHAAKLPDPICYEAMLNVLVTLKRTDLIPEYLERMEKAHIHMTAYVANLVIKGFAAAGNIEQARDVFEGLTDPPQGVAAPNNHAAYDSSPRRVSTMEPVFREPSTWETMIRAELGNGNRDNALVLLERLKARRFPPAVYGRISGILSTDPVSIWDGVGLASPQSPQSLPSE